MTIAALYVQTGGSYFGLDGVDSWDEKRDARSYRYGHRAKKATWLYAVRCELPELRWGSISDQETKVWVSWCGNRTGRSGSVERMGKRERSATPHEFRDILLAMARSVR